MPTVIDKSASVLDSMVAQVQNRRGATGTVPATVAAAKAEPAPPELSGSVEQAKMIVQAAAAAMREAAGAMGFYSERLFREAQALEYGMDLVFSVLGPAGPKPVNVEEARKRAEAEADARARDRANAVEFNVEKAANGENPWTPVEIDAQEIPASERAIGEMLAAAPPVIASHTLPNGREVQVTMTAQQAKDIIGWTCPIHGEVVTKHSQRTGRDYQACPREGCIEIERRS